MCDADLPTSVILFLVTSRISSGAVTPASGENQSCHTGTVGSSPAVGSWRWSQLLLPQTALELWFLTTSENMSLGPSIASGVLPFDRAVNQGRAELGQAVLWKSWACTHSDETVSWKDEGKWNTLLKGEDPKENSWSNGKSLSERKFSVEYQEIFASN